MASWVDSRGIRQYDGSVQKITADGQLSYSSELDTDAGEVLLRDWFSPGLAATGVTAEAIGSFALGDPALHHVRVSWAMPDRFRNNGITHLTIVSTPPETDLVLAAPRNWINTIAFPVSDDAKDTEFVYRVLCHQPNHVAVSEPSDPVIPSSVALDA